jgi:hypothetical protein
MDYIVWLIWDSDMSDYQHVQLSINHVAVVAYTLA